MDLIRQQQFDLSVRKGCGGMMMVVVMKGNRRRADGGTCLCFRGACAGLSWAKGGVHAKLAEVSHWKTYRIGKENMNSFVSY